MSMRITVLCDNSVGPISGTLGEHGFAALIEQDRGGPILFDTGQGLTLDTGQLRIDLAQGERRLRLAGSLDPIRLEVTERR